MANAIKIYLRRQLHKQIIPLGCTKQVSISIPFQKLQKECIIESQNGLKGTLKFQFPCHGQRHFSWDQVAQSGIPPLDLLLCWRPKSWICNGATVKYLKQTWERQLQEQKCSVFVPYLLPLLTPSLTRLKINYIFALPRAEVSSAPRSEVIAGYSHELVSNLAGSAAVWNGHPQGILESTTPNSLLPEQLIFAGCWSWAVTLTVQLLAATKKPLISWSFQAREETSFKAHLKGFLSIFQRAGSKHAESRALSENI